jgi:cytosine/adenosine deaminase-related metal-dependent hydrolase
MRKFSAHRIYPVNSPPISFGIVETDDDGTIRNIRSTGGKPVEEAGLEFYPGIIIPGMVNTHCHLEVSHLKGQIPEHTGISGFVSSLQKLRQIEPERIIQAAAEADRVMYLQGISAVGDISNLEITLPIKKISRIRYHTFIEIYGFDPVVSAARFHHGLHLAKLFSEAGLPHTLSPHAPYSVGEEMWNLLAGASSLTGRISMHHNESPEERALLENGEGRLADSFRLAGFDISHLPAEAPDAFALLGKYLPASDWILVHNTLMNSIPSPAGIKQGVYWVLCPRSNQYIENLLPDIEGFAANGLTVCLGTDSLASNHSLSILDEMKVILDSVPGVDFDTVLRWATINGAHALDMQNQLGSIETGKRPGLVNIPVFDWTKNRLGQASQPVRLI